MIEHKKYLKNLLDQNGLTVKEAALDTLLLFLTQLLQWNKVFNLTAITDPKEMLTRHLLDSLIIAPFLTGERILDVGTGGGLPGIPLAIVLPEKNFTLLDSNQKKTRFLTQLKLDLKISNIDVVAARVEHYRSALLFDTILTRAFASLRVMLENTKHLIAKHGQFVAMKGTYPDIELNEIPKNFKVTAVHKLHIKGLNAERHLVCMEKIDNGKNNSNS